MDEEGSAGVLQLSLVDNGIDFILKGIDELFDDQHAWAGYSLPRNVPVSRFKYGYLHLFSGFLLLLKERLSRHIPELIFKGKLPDIRQRLARGDIPNTVDLDEALERLEMGPKVTFSSEELKVIRRMQRHRNLFEHYQVLGNKDELWDAATEFLALVDTFLISELKIEIQSSSSSLELSRKIQTIESVWQRAKAQREDEWRAHIARQLETFRETREDVLHDLNADYWESKGYEQPFIYCPECSQETLIANGEFAGICTNVECENVDPIAKCDRCGEIMVGFPWDFNLCENCDAYIRSE